MNILTEDDIGPIMEMLKSGMNKTKFIALFSKKPTKQSDGTYKLSPAQFKIRNPLEVTPSMIPTVKSHVVSTIGRFIFNYYVLYEVFDKLIPYRNETISKTIDDLESEIVAGINNKKTDPEAYAKYILRIEALGDLSEVLTPGMSEELVIPRKDILNMLKNYTKQYDFEKMSDSEKVATITKIEKELLAKSQELLKKYPAFRSFTSGEKPKFSLTYKNSRISVGAIADPLTGGFSVIVENFGNGPSAKSQALLANNSLVGFYGRAIDTVQGGVLGKETVAVMQTIEKDPDPHSFCGTNLTIKSKVDDDLTSSWYKNSKGERVQLTAAHINEIRGQIVDLYTPMFCKNEKICSVCLGSYMYEANIEAVGLTAMRVTSGVLYASMKRMHDTSIRVTEIDLLDQFYEY